MGELLDAVALSISVPSPFPSSTIVSTLLPVVREFFQIIMVSLELRVSLFRLFFITSKFLFFFFFNFCRIFCLLGASVSSIV